MLDWDQKDNFNKPPSQRTAAHTDSLLDAIRSLGISFNIWEKKDANGKGSGTYDFTSLMGSDKKSLLEKLPSKLGEILMPDTSSTVVQLWEVLFNYMTFFYSKYFDNLIFYHKRIRVYSIIKQFVTLQVCMHYLTI